MPTPARTTFHQLCRAGFVSRMSRTHTNEDDLAAMMAEQYGTTWTGDDIRRMHDEGYPSTVLDMVAGTDGRNALDLIAQTLQMAIPGPHITCPTCSCGITYAQRLELAMTFVEDGVEHLMGDIQRMRAEAGRGPQSETCCDNGLRQETA